MTGIVVTGASGQLGRAFASLLPNAAFLTRSGLDLAEPARIAPTLDAFHPTTVINCAAYTAVDRAEEEEALATVVNGAAVGEMAEYCQARGSRFVTFSTDYVFAGDSDRPWVESDATDPINAYGRSKLVGEHRALAAGGLVIRTSWLVSGTHPNFIATMLRLASAGGPMRVVDDQVGCPTICGDLATATLGALDSGATGLVHLSNQEPTTWFEFARFAIDHAGMTPVIEPCSSDEYPTAARRPAYSVLGSERLDELGVEPLPRWRDSLPAVVDSLYSNGVVA